ncbi:unnamed protein product [Linum trigynum]|uniref:Protein EARLY FLOWERING 4 domain-containing protein n=1 Tax=Linum trigynum TaxID=586398 RepID=A0AAV2FW67_9ROSI
MNRNPLAEASSMEDTKARSGITASGSPAGESWSHRGGGKEDRLIRNSNGGGSEGEEYDKEAWDALSKSFRQAQCVLDQNRGLIEQVNANNQSKIPENLTKNVSLICEINGNISKVMSIYSDLSVNFTRNAAEASVGMNSLEKLYMKFLINYPVFSHNT